MSRCEAGNNVHRLHPCETCGAKANEECGESFFKKDWVQELKALLDSQPEHSWTVPEGFHRFNEVVGLRDPICHVTQDELVAFHQEIKEIIESEKPKPSLPKRLWAWLNSYTIIIWRT